MENCCCNKETIRSKEEQKDLENRINRIVGQMNGIKSMIEENRYCGDIIIQLSAIDKAIKSLANLMLDRHLHTCVERDIKDGDFSVLDEITDMFKRFQ